MRTEEVRLANALSEMQISTKILAQFPKNWSHGNMHGLHEISGKTRGPTLEFNSSWILVNGQCHQRPPLKGLPMPQ